MARIRILSGIQPTGSKHLGNYIGAIRQYVAMQDDGEALYLVVDLHSLTVTPDPAKLREDTRQTVALLVAAGLHPERCVLFVQSHVGGEHCELAWYLQCVASFGELSRMTQFKDKAEGRDHVTAGLFTYPVLMAADILLYDAARVPVGHDQKQHVELARDLAQRFNARYGDTFVIPEPFIPPVGGRIMDLQDPTKKMSTTGGTPKGTVHIIDDADTVRKKFRSAVTDTGSEVRAAPDKPGIANLLEIMAVVTGRTVADIEHEFVGQQYGSFKATVGEAVAEHLAPIRARYLELIADRGELDRILADGAARARAIAAPKVARVRAAMGCLAPVTSFT